MILSQRSNLLLSIDPDPVSGNFMLGVAVTFVRQNVDVEPKFKIISSQSFVILVSRYKAFYFNVQG